jgi:hypothetical protein
MTRAAWHSTWTRMRGASRRRSWLTWEEFQATLATLGVSLSPYHVRLATQSCPPVRVHGGKRYEERHVQMAVFYAKAKRLAFVESEPQHEEATA